MSKTTADKIMLGCGVVSVGGSPLGLTRGGSVFAVEREYREIAADCDRGPVKGRIVIDTERAKLTVNALEPFAMDEIKRYWPGLDVDTAESTYDEVTGTLTIAAGDYNDVTFVGQTKDGKAVTIELDDAINLENIEWTLEEKNEVIPALGFTATYDETTRTTPPWRVKFAKATSYAVVLTITSNGSDPVTGAEVTLYGQTVTTAADGLATFASIPAGTNYAFTVVKGGYETYFGAVDVSEATADTVTLTAIT